MQNFSRHTKGITRNGLAGDHPTSKSNVHDGFAPKKSIVILSNEKASNLVVPTSQLSQYSPGIQSHILSRLST